MESGCIVEFIDRQKVLCAVVLEIKKQRLRLLTENNREVNLSASRLLHTDKVRLDLSIGRSKVVDTLKEVAGKRRTLINNVDIKDLWEILNTEQEWIDLATMTAFCFPEDPTGDHEAAVIRAFFADRLYFKFNSDRFFPNSEAQVEQITTQREEEKRKNRIVEIGGLWLKAMLNSAKAPSADITESEKAEVAGILKSYYLFGKESRHRLLAKDMIAKAEFHGNEGIFQLLVKLGVFDENENIELLRQEIVIDFSEPVLESVKHLLKSLPELDQDARRRDLTDLPLITIDGQSTLDFDDALSIEKMGDQYRLGIHIADVGHYVRRDDEVDQEALARGSSIYMPDQKISMLPSGLAEGLCSLKAGALRPAISTIVTLSKSLKILDYKIIPSLVKVKRQLTYYEVNLAADEDEDILLLREFAEKFRQTRFENGAVHISVPEINVWIGENREVTVNRINRESPGRMLVAEIMILANWLMAKFLAENNVPAIFRSQAEPRERLYKNGEGTLFQNWMQRRLLSRFALISNSKKHSGLGLDAYVTATSPIRKYFDLVTQRQLRAVFGMEKPYSSEEIENIIQILAIPMSQVSRAQYTRQRYWLLKYLEKMAGHKEEAIVLGKRRDGYQILLTEYMIECDLAYYSGFQLKPEDLVQVTLQKVDARKDIIRVYI
jgi:exoribonuclease-2